MVRSVAGVSEVAEIVGAHEERFDGTGYPAGLSGEDIPVESRIVACAAAHVKLAQTLGGKDAAAALERQSGQRARSRCRRRRARAAGREPATARHTGRPTLPGRCRGRVALAAGPSWAAMAYPLLLSPLRIGPIEIRNRIVSTAHQTTLVEDGLPTDDFVAYHAARAQGGAGLICIEATAVHPSGLLTGHTIAGYDPRVVERLARVADAVHAGGARLFAQLFHGGREQIDSPPRAPAVAPSAVPSQRFKVEPRALSSGEIEEIIAHHELVAGHARAAGLDGIELCASHGYLPTQFLSERSNRRDDAWGGDAARRMRYVREALLAMRRGAGAGLAVGIRLSADETLPEGRHAPETAAILRTLADEGLIDYASAVIGDSASYLGAAWIVPPPPVARDAMREPAGILRAQLSVPLIATSRIHEPVEAEALLAAGAADAVGMTRALIADPDLPRRIVEGARTSASSAPAAIRAASATTTSGLPISCLQNPRTGREARMPGRRRRPARACS